MYGVCTVVGGIRGVYGCVRGREACWVYYTSVFGRKRGSLRNRRAPESPPSSRFTVGQVLGLLPSFPVSLLARYWTPWVHTTLYMPVYTTWYMPPLPTQVGVPASSQPC